MDNFMTIEAMEQYTTAFDNIVLSGGGIKGLIHLGVINGLIKAGLIKTNKLKGIAGSSVGALIGCFIVLGFSIYDIWNFILKIDFKKLVKPNLFSILTEYGIENGTTMITTLDQIIQQKTGVSDITFEILFLLTGIQYHVIGSCMTTKTEIVFNHINTPNTKVIDAIRISISIPGFFTPVIIDGMSYVDGAVLNNYPIDLFKENYDRTVGIVLCNDYHTEYNCPEQFFIALFNLFLYRQQMMSLNVIDHPGTIKVTKTIKGVTFCSFDITNDVKEQLFNLGEQTAKEAIESWKIITHDENLF